MTWNNINLKVFPLLLPPPSHFPCSTTHSFVHMGVRGIRAIRVRLPLTILMQEYNINVFYFYDATGSRYTPSTHINIFGTPVFLFAFLKVFWRAVLRFRLAARRTCCLVSQKKRKRFVFGFDCDACVCLCVSFGANIFQNPIYRPIGSSQRCKTGFWRVHNDDDDDDNGAYYCNKNDITHEPIGDNE